MRMLLHGYINCLYAFTVELTSYFYKNSIILAYVVYEHDSFVTLEY